MVVIAPLIAIVLGEAYSSLESTSPPAYCNIENISALAPALNLIDQERRNLVWLAQERRGDPAYYSSDLLAGYEAAQGLITRMMLACVSD